MEKAPKKLIGLVGAGGFAREVMPILRNQLSGVSDGAGASLVFVETSPSGTDVHGVPIMSEEAFVAAPAAQKCYNVAIADSVVRQTISERMAHHGIMPITIMASTTVVYDRIEIGEGAVVCDYCMLTSDARIGILNRGEAAFRFVRAVRDSLMRYLPIDRREALTSTQWDAVYRIADERYRRSGPPGHREG